MFWKVRTRHALVISHHGWTTSWTSSHLNPGSLTFFIFPFIPFFSCPPLFPKHSFLDMMTQTQNEATTLLFFVVGFFSSILGFKNSVLTYMPSFSAAVWRDPMQGGGKCYGSVRIRFKFFFFPVTFSEDDEGISLSFSQDAKSNAIKSFIKKSKSKQRIQHVPLTTCWIFLKFPF